MLNPVNTSTLDALHADAFLANGQPAGASTSSQDSGAWLDALKHELGSGAQSGGTPPITTQMLSTAPQGGQAAAGAMPSSMTAQAENESVPSRAMRAAINNALSLVNNLGNSSNPPQNAGSTFVQLDAQPSGPTNDDANRPAVAMANAINQALSLLNNTGNSNNAPQSAGNAFVQLDAQPSGPTNDDANRPAVAMAIDINHILSLVNNTDTSSNPPQMAGNSSVQLDTQPNQVTADDTVTDAQKQAATEAVKIYGQNPSEIALGAANLQHAG